MSQAIFAAKWFCASARKCFINSIKKNLKDTISIVYLFVLVVHDVIEPFPVANFEHSFDI